MDLLRGRTGEKGGTKTIRRLILGAGTQAMQQLSGESTFIWVKRMNVGVWDSGSDIDNFVARHQRHKLLSTHGPDQIRWP